MHCTDKSRRVIREDELTSGKLFVQGPEVYVWYRGTCLVLWYMFGTVVHVWHYGTCLVPWYMFGIVVFDWSCCSSMDLKFYRHSYDYHQTFEGNKTVLKNIKSVHTQWHSN